MSTSDLFPSILSRLDVHRLAELLSELEPTVPGNHVIARCPQCGQREAYAYPSDHVWPRLRCNRQNNCGYDCSLWAFVVEREGSKLAALQCLCAAVGIRLDDDRDQSARPARRRYAPAPLRYSKPAPAPPDPDDERAWRAMIQRCEPLHRTAGEEYLSARGVPVGIAHAAGARYLADWFGQPAVLFPIRDADGALVAVQGRYLRPSADPKTRSKGSIRAGAFFAPGALDGPVVIVMEAPIDALSLAAAGQSAVALCGTPVKDWLIDLWWLKAVWLAFDADSAGDTASDKWAEQLRAVGANVRRLRPEGAKDWNELLQRLGVDGLQALLRAVPGMTNTRAAALCDELIGELAGEDNRRIRELWDAFYATCDLLDGFSSIDDPFASSSLSTLGPAVDAALTKAGIGKTEEAGANSLPDRPSL